MLRIHFTSEDLRRVTVAQRPDPLWDVLLSLHVLQEKGDPVFREWRRQVPAARTPGIRLLVELAPPSGYSPDFLTPGRGEAGIECQIDRLLSTPRARLRDDLTYMASEQPVTPWVRELATGGLPALNRLARAVENYHRSCLAPYQDVIHTHLEADRIRRGRLLMRGGIDGLLAGLHRSVSWRPPVLEVADYVDHDIHLWGRGLVLLPSLFCRRHPITLRHVGEPPVLVYPVSPPPGWLPRAGERESGRDALSDLLGHTRAAVLRACVDTITTTQLADRAGVSISSASRQATVLREAGLLDTRRDGGAVLHDLTDLGIALLNGRHTAPRP
ncbi:ArsR/SmtB family transcription factor [Sphaerisporangium fuscum]|uniref:ArsR/SmtB family transcription factor n=1 Tax=Sphaerisporangium fuscum TaxID=2835868 RepID=UPI001BDCD291|nr:winged helix-turn-helix domain-containing protein [Sphaerisporangium fuscum]